MANWDENSPGDSDVISGFPANERSARSAVKTNFGIDHVETDGATVGMHEAVRLISQGSDPAAAAGRGALYTKTPSGVELYYRDAAGNVLQLTNGGVSALLSSTNTWTGANTLSNASNVFHGNGANLTALNATQLTSGTVPVARVSGSYTGITGVGTLAAGAITTSFGNINIGSSTFTGNGSGLSSLNASNISSGTLNNARLDGEVWRHTTSGLTSGDVTVSTGDPSGGSNGDIWLKREA